MPSEALIDLFKLIAGDVEVLKARALDRWELSELVKRDIEPLELHEALLLSEDAGIFDPVVGKVQMHNPVQVLH